VAARPQSVDDPGDNVDRLSIIADIAAPAAIRMPA
jgi:hypothetical protein